MKQQYTLIKDTEANQLIVKEFGELDKDIMSLLCEERFDAAKVMAALAAGKPALIAALRTDNLYPPILQAEQLAEAVTALYGSEEQQTVELQFDDREMLTALPGIPDTLENMEEEVEIEEEEEEEESDELDELLDDDEIKIKSASSPLQIADEDQVDTEEEN